MHVALLVKHTQRFEDTSRDILQLFPIEGSRDRGIQKVVFQMPQHNRRRCRRLFDLVNQRPQVRSATLEALEDIPFVLHARMAMDAFDDHRLPDWVPACGQLRGPFLDLSRSK